MTTPEKAFDLVERYVREVGRHLPKKLRGDVEDELRTLLKDSLEERVRTGQRAMNEALAAEVLGQFGKPEKVAERYLPEPGFLIGPRFFPAFLVVAKIVLWFVGGWLLFWYLFALFSAPHVAERLPAFFRPGSFAGLIGEFLVIAFQNLAILVLVFAILERVVGPEEAKKAEDWDPRKLPALQDPDRVSPVGHVFSIYFLVLFLVVLNFFPKYLGLIFYADGRLWTVPYYEMGFRIPVLLLDVSCALAIALNVIVLRDGRWRRRTRWAEFGLGVFNAFVLLLVVTNSPLVGMDNALMEKLGFFPPLEQVESLGNVRRGFAVLGRIVVFILKIALVGTLIASGFRLYRLLTRPPAEAEPAA